MTGLTQAELDALPAVFPLWPDAGRALNISRSHTYELNQEGRFPVRVHKLGRALRVTRADLMAYLKSQKVA